MIRIFRKCGSRGAWLLFLLQVVRKAAFYYKSSSPKHSYESSEDCENPLIGYIRPLIGRLGLGLGTKALWTGYTTSSGKCKCTGIMLIFCPTFLYCSSLVDSCTRAAWVLICRAEDWGNITKVGILSLEFRAMMKAIIWRHKKSLKEKWQFANLWASTTMLKNQNEAVSQQCGELSNL